MPADLPLANNNDNTDEITDLAESASITINETPDTRENNNALPDHNPHWSPLDGDIDEYQPLYSPWNSGLTRDILKHHQSAAASAQPLRETPIPVTSVAAPPASPPM